LSINMALLDKLKFWKKEEPEFDMGKFPGLEAPDQTQPGMGSAPGMPGLTEMPASEGAMAGFEDIGNAPPAPFPGMPGASAIEQPGRSLALPGGLPVGRGQSAPSAFAPAPVQQVQPQQDIMRDMQIVNAKLDTLKALLDSVNVKLDRIERVQAPREEPVELSVRRWR
jgi:hypothetical protein